MELVSQKKSVFSKFVPESLAVSPAVAAPIAILAINQAGIHNTIFTPFDRVRIISNQIGIFQTFSSSYLTLIFSFICDNAKKKSQAVQKGLEYIQKYIRLSRAIHGFG